MAYTDIDKPSDYFTAFKWTGNGASSRALTGVGFQGNWLWSKPNTGHNHYLVDTVRGVDNKSLISDATTAEDTTGTHGHFDSIDADGFTGTLAGGGYNFNRDALEFIAWIWKAGTSFTNDASGTGIGSIDSTGSFNNDSGFSIVSYTGTGTAGTIKHGLSSAPSMIICKNRTDSEGWPVYHKSLGASAYLRLDVTDAVVSNDTSWNGVEPTSTVFSIKNDNRTNGSSDAFIAYCFSEKQGYSKFGSYVGNGNVSGSYIHLGFKPAFFLFKENSASEGWVIKDNKTETFNPNLEHFRADTTDAKNADGWSGMDFLSNGIKLRTSDGSMNQSGATYIYMAFAENPFVTSTGVPATAR